MRIKIVPVFTFMLIALSLCGAAYSHWIDSAEIHGLATMGKWKAKIRIMKTLEGSYTNSETGDKIIEPTSIIAIAAGFPTIFKLKITVKNSGSIKLTDVTVTDTIKNTVAPREWEADKGIVNWTDYSQDNEPWDGVHFGFNKLTWEIGSMGPKEIVCLEIWIETLQNNTNNYEPTSGDEGNELEIEINEGATVKAKSTFKKLSTTTESITLVIGDDDVVENGLGVIISPELPYSTPWAEDKYP